MEKLRSDPKAKGPYTIQGSAIGSKYGGTAPEGFGVGCGAQIRVLFAPIVLATLRRLADLHTLSMRTSENRLLSGRVAIVTGASAGIGAATARTLALAGASVVLTARRLDRLEGLTAEIEEAGGRALPLRADVVSLEETREVVRRTLEKFGRIDILVNNAGIMPVAPLADVRVDDWTAMIDVNIKGVLHFLSAVLPHMIEQRSGHIVNVGSVAGRRPFPGGSVYAATKFAVRALSWGLHLELGNAHGIRVTDIQPGFVSTELLDGDPDTAAAWTEAWKGRRTLQPEDVARAIEFAVTSPDHVSVSEILVRPTDQPT